MKFYKQINTVTNKIFHNFKHKIKVLPYFFAIALLFFVYFFSNYRNSLFSDIKSLKIPKIPDKIKAYMDSQVPHYGTGCVDVAFKWFDYYSFEIKDKVKVKSTGVCSGHYNNLSNQSFRIKYGKEDFRLKSISSELHPGGGIADNAFMFVFPEVATYDIAKEFTKLTPSADIVYLNGDRNNIMVNINDFLKNSVREKYLIDWHGLFLTNKFSQVDKTRYFDKEWKTRNSKEENLKKEFLNFLAPFLDAVDKDISQKSETNMDVKSYERYLSLNAIFSSGHMDNHNLLFTADKNKEGAFKWDQVIYDMNGLEGLRSSPFINLNYISEFFLRDPAFIYEYLLDLNYLTEEVLGKGKISDYYDKFECSRTDSYSGFAESLLKITNTWITPKDINGLCSSVKKIKDFEKIRYMDLIREMNNSDFRWNYIKKENETYLAVWNTTFIPAKIENIKCGIFSCADSWTLVNKPWWEKENNIISSGVTRKYAEVDYENTKNGVRLIPQPYEYLYKWNNSGKLPDANNISFSVSNAITGSKIYAVRDNYPVLEIKTPQISGEKFKHQLEIKIENVLDSDPGLEKLDAESLLSGKTPWRLEVSAPKCVSVSSESLRYVFDCSVANPKQWNFVLDYSVILFYKGARIREYSGEFFQDYKPSPEGEILNSSTIESYKLNSIDGAKGKKGYEYFLQYIKNNGKAIELEKIIREQKNLYYLPENKIFDIVEDLNLDNSVLIIDKGSKFSIWPLAKIKAEMIIAVGDKENPIVFNSKTGLPFWYGIEIGKGGIFSNIKVFGVGNVNQGSIFGNDLIFLGIDNGEFLLNSSDVKCSNCVVDIANSSFSNSEWAVKTSNSTVNLANISCTSNEYCIDTTDDLIKVDNIKGYNLKAWVFNVDGASTDLDIKNVSATDVPAAISMKNYPVVDYDIDKMVLTNVKIPAINLDDQSIYDKYIKASPDDFESEYKNILKRDKKDSSIFYFKNNPIVIKEDLIVPESVTLEISEGMKINLEKKASILSYGKIVAKGLKGKEIYFSGSNKKNNPWGAVVLKGEKSSGIFDYVVFENGGPDYLTGFEYSGALTADHSNELIVTNSIFKNNSGHDGLNCKYSLCKISDNIFENNKMDGVDFDFANSSSEIFNNKFFKNGNDGIDVSFDQSKIYGNEIKDSGDKCISIGEKSHSIVFNNFFAGCQIGVEAKDSSEPILSNNSFVSNEIALNSYQKKKRFEKGGTIISYNSLYENNSKIFEEDSESKINIVKEFRRDIYEKDLTFFNTKEAKYGLK
jgi:hypothetical protein